MNEVKDFSFRGGEGGMTVDARLRRGARFWEASALGEVMGGRWLVPPPEEGCPVSGVSIDSRSIRAGEAFFAVAGERHDGHDYIVGAAASGASMLVVSRESAAGSLQGELARTPALLVADVTAALQALAKAWREVLAACGMTVIAVGGSNGKTTTRHLIHTLASARLRGTQSPKSFNNHLGVPLTLLGASSGDDFVVAEVGTNHPGEVAMLAGLIEPDIGVIVSIGEEHLEFFGTIENVAREEAALVAAVRGSGLAIVCDDSCWPAGVRPRVGEDVKLVQFGEAEGADVRVIRSDAASGAAGRGRVLSSAFSVELSDRFKALIGSGESASGEFSGRWQLELPWPGAHQAVNAGAAVAVTLALGVEAEVIGEAMRNAQPVSGRMEAMRFGQSVTVLNDSYNANPSSVRVAIEALCRLPGLRRVLILGDMLELGERAESCHRAVGAQLAGLGTTDGGGEGLGAKAVDLAVFIGPGAQMSARELRGHWPLDSVHGFGEWFDDLPGLVAALLESGDVVVIKGSRGMGLERLLPAIERRFGPRAKA